MKDSWEFAGRNRPSNADIAQQEKQNRTGLHHAPRVGALVRQRRRESLLGGQAVRLDARLPRRRTLAALGPAVLPLQRPRLRGQRERRRRRRLADPLPRLAPWYDYVERFAGISGTRDGLPQLPDGQFLPPMEMNCLEQQVQGPHREVLRRARDDHRPRRQPHAAAQRPRQLSVPQPLHPRLPVRRLLQQQRRDAAGRVRDRQADAASVLDRHRADLRPKTGRATGVRIVDAETNQTTEYFARVIFLCASAIASTFILLNSKSDRFPNGLGNDSGELGHNLMDHHFKVGANGLSEDFGDRFYRGQRPNGIYIPRFRNLDAKSRQKDYIRGFGYQGSASRENWARGIKELSYFGADLKADLIAPGPVALRHRLVGRVPAVPREPHVPERRRARQVGTADRDLRLPAGRPTSSTCART